MGSTLVVRGRVSTATSEFFLMASIFPTFWLKKRCMHADPTEAVICDGHEIQEQEHHTGIGAGLPVADGGGGGDDTTPGVRQILWSTTSGGSHRTGTITKLTNRNILQNCRKLSAIVLSDSTQ